MSEAVPPADSSAGIAGLDEAGQPQAGTRGFERPAGMAGLAATLILAGVLAGFGVQSFGKARTELLAEAAILAESATENTTRQIEAADLFLDRARQLAGQTDWRDIGQQARTSAELQRLGSLIPAVRRLTVWDEAGRPLATSAAEIKPEVNAADRSYFVAQRETDAGLYVSEPLTGRFDGTPILVLSRRVSRPDGGFAGVVSLSLLPATLTGRVATLGADSGITVTWERDGSAAASQPDTARGDVLTVRRSAGPYPIGIRAEIPASAVRDRWIARSLPYLSLGLLVVLATATGTWVLRRKAAAQGAYRTALSRLTDRLRHVNAELEARVAERTAALSDAVAQRDLLMREVNHRLKNSLQLACALVQMQGQTVRTPEVRQQLADTVSRLQAIARVHDQLYRTEDVRRVEASAYLRSLCADLEQSALASQRFWRIAVEAETIDMATDQAVPLGLMVNELVTNALKHGQPVAAGEQAWTVEVGLARQPDGDVLLTVRDHGPGLPPDTLKRQSGSLGMKLLNGLTRQLNAKLSVEQAMPGARFTVRFRPQPLV